MLDAVLWQRRVSLARALSFLIYACVRVKSNESELAVEEEENCCTRIICVAAVSLTKAQKQKGEGKS